MTTRYAKTEAGRQAIRDRSQALSRPARNLLLIVDGRRTGREWVALVQGSSEADLAQLIEAGLIEALGGGGEVLQAPPAVAVAQAPSELPSQVAQQGPQLPSHLPAPEPSLPPAQPLPVPPSELSPADSSQAQAPAPLAPVAATDPHSMPAPVPTAPSPAPSPSSRKSRSRFPSVLPPMLTSPPEAPPVLAAPPVSAAPSVSAAAPASATASLPAATLSATPSDLAPDALVKPRKGMTALMPEEDLRPVPVRLQDVSYRHLYDTMTAQARPLLGLIKGYRMVLDVEKCRTAEELRRLALRFIDEVRAAQGVGAAYRVTEAMCKAPEG